MYRRTAVKTQNRNVQLGQVLNAFGLGIILMVVRRHPRVQVCAALAMSSIQQQGRDSSYLQRESALDYACWMLARWITPHSDATEPTMHVG